MNAIERMAMIAFQDQLGLVAVSSLAGILFFRI